MLEVALIPAEEYGIATGAQNLEQGSQLTDVPIAEQMQIAPLPVGIAGLSRSHGTHDAPP
jgi:hypothetical protein